MSTIAEFDLGAVLKPVDVLISVERLSVLLNVHHPQLIGVRYYQMQSRRVEREAERSLCLVPSCLYCFLLIVPDFDRFVLPCSRHQRLSDADIHTHNRAVVVLEAHLLKCELRLLFIYSQFSLYQLPVAEHRPKLIVEHCYALGRQLLVEVNYCFEYKSTLRLISVYGYSPYSAHQEPLTPRRDALRGERQGHLLLENSFLVHNHKLCLG